MMKVMSYQDIRIGNNYFRNIMSQIVIKANFFQRLFERYENTSEIFKNKTKGYTFYIL